MEFDAALDICREALLVSLILSAPVLVAGLVVGLLISLLQTITQLQDQTISTVPKIVAMVGISILITPWMAQRMLEYTQAMFAAR